MPYTVYENRPTNRATVHISTCRYIKQHGGVSTTIPPTGEYYEGFKTPEAALDKAKSTGRHVHTCRGCSPPISN